MFRVSCLEDAALLFRGERLEAKGERLEARGKGIKNELDIQLIFHIYL